MLPDILSNLAISPHFWVFFLLYAFIEYTAALYFRNYYYGFGINYFHYTNWKDLFLMGFKNLKIFTITVVSIMPFKLYLELGDILYNKLSLNSLTSIIIFSLIYLSPYYIGVPLLVITLAKNDYKYIQLGLKILFLSSEKSVHKLNVKFKNGKILENVLSIGSTANFHFFYNRIDSVCHVVDKNNIDFLSYTNQIELKVNKKRKRQKSKRTMSN
jgi:hypothetical protein